MTPTPTQPFAPHTDEAPTATQALSPSLERDANGDLLWLEADGTRIPVQAVRNFPLSAPEEGVSLVDGDGHERYWIDSLAPLPRPQRQLILESLAPRDFQPIIQRIVKISGQATPCRWQIQTDRGDTTLHLNAEEDIRRLPDGKLLIADACGVSFLIEGIGSLDRHSKRLLDHFL